jgi:hypothetical protein
MTTHRNTWKQAERDVANELGGVRIPCSGNGGITGDVLCDRMHVEVKMREKLILHPWYQKAKKDAQKMKIVKPVVLAVRMKGTHSIYVIMEIKDFKQFLNQGEKKDGDNPI